MIRVIKRAFSQKKLSSNDLSTSHGQAIHGNDSLEQHLSLFDLLCIGVAATLGSGVFALTGSVAREFTGPSVIISWLIAGVACSISAMSFAELCSRFPSSVSSYSFVYNSLGEWPAVIAFWCLTLECGLSGTIQPMPY